MAGRASPHITLTDFVDIVAKSGTQKITKIRQVKQRPPYSPLADFYKKARAFIVDTHLRNLPKSHLGELLAQLTDPKKQRNYPDVTAGYAKWWGRKNLRWFTPPSGVFAAHGVEVGIKPELGLMVNDTPYIIKLYFKGEALTKSKTELVTHLMEITLRKMCAPADAIMSVLDTRQAKLIAPSASASVLTAGLEAELAYIAALWDRL